MAIPLVPVGDLIKSVRFSTFFNNITLLISRRCENERKNRPIPKQRSRGIEASVLPGCPTASRYERPTQLYKWAAKETWPLETQWRRQTPVKQAGIWRKKSRKAQQRQPELDTYPWYEVIKGESGSVSTLLKPIVDRRIEKITLYKESSSV